MRRVSIAMVLAASAVSLVVPSGAGAVNVLGEQVNTFGGAYFWDQSMLASVWPIGAYQDNQVLDASFNGQVNARCSSGTEWVYSSSGTTVGSSDMYISPGLNIARGTWTGSIESPTCNDARTYKMHIDLQANGSQTTTGPTYRYPTSVFYYTERRGIGGDPATGYFCWTNSAGNCIENTTLTGGRYQQIGRYVWTQ